jgi:hypothetical protein
MLLMQLFCISVTIAAVGLVACGGEDPSPPVGERGAVETCTGPVDTFAPGLSRPGEGERLRFTLLASDPAPLRKGDHRWTLAVTDAGNSPVGGATITVTPFMPDHGHGTPIKTTVRPDASPGQYVLEPVNLFMPGVWRVQIDVEKEGTTDTAAFRFCIPR